jgi:hypothetical protein
MVPGQHRRPRIEPLDKEPNILHARHVARTPQRRGPERPRPIRHDIEERPRHLRIRLALKKTKKRRPLPAVPVMPLVD